MKWFMPPMPRVLSRTQAETHEPSTVTSIRSSVVTEYSPGSTFMARRPKVVS